MQQNAGAQPPRAPSARRSLASRSLWTRRGQDLIGAQWAAISPNTARKSGPNDHKDEMPQEQPSRGSATGAFMQGNFLGKYTRVVALGPEDNQLLTLKKLHIKVSVHLSMAFIKLQGEWVYDKPCESTTTRSPPGFVFELPKLHTTTVTTASASLASGKKFETHVVDSTAALTGFKNNEGRGMAFAMQLYREKSGYDPSTYHPEMFSLPFHGVKANETVQISAEFMDTLSFEDGRFKLALPLGIPEETLAAKIADVVSFDVTLDIPKYIMREARQDPKMQIWKSEGLALRDTQPPQAIGAPSSANPGALTPAEPDAASASTTMHLSLDPTASQSGGDFELSYPAWSDSIQTQVVHDQTPSIQIRGKNKNPVEVPGGVITTFLAPPRPDAAQSSTSHLPRDVVIVLDRSGSMGFSEVFSHAQEAVVAALKALRPEDRFAICCFDDRQIWFGGCYPEPSDSDVGSLMGALGLDGGDLNFTSTLAASGVLLVDPTSKSQAAADGTPAAPEVQEFPAGSKPICIRAKKEFVDRAINWVREVEPGGLTDILSPLKQAFWGLLSENLQNEPVPQPIGADEGEAAREDGARRGRIKVKDAQRLRSVFVVTDGAVENEREICKFAGCIAPEVRIFAFGIGVDCNAYFLRKLASIGRGYADVCMLRSRVHEKMLNLFKHARLAVLKDVRVELEPLPSLSGEEKTQVLEQLAALDERSWCPQRVPDLYCHAPAVVSLRYSGVLPAGLQIRVSGTLASGERWQSARDLSAAKFMPLSKVFAQQFVDMMVADAWLADLDSPEGARFKQRAISLAVSEGISCPFTSMVAVETNEKQSAASGSGDKRVARQRFDLSKHQKILVLGGALAGAVAFGSVMYTSVIATGAEAAASGAAEGAAEGVDGADGCCDDGGCCECCDCCDPETLADCLACV